MPRKKRIIHSGYPYHVMLRGNGGQHIFRDDEDRVRFCLLMQCAIERHDILVHGFCLMNNHVHLLLEPTGLGLSAGVHAFAFRYAQYFNNKYNCKGHLFQGRFKGVIVQGGTYLRRLIRYIHRNPVRAQMVIHPHEYKWSSHLAYLDLNAYTWLSKHRVHAMFNSDAASKESVSNYLALFTDYMTASDADAKDQLAAIQRSTSLGAYGDLNFVRQFTDNNVDDLELLLKQQNEDNSKVGLSDLVLAVCEHFEVSTEHMCTQSREPRVVSARAVVSLVATRSKIASLSELAEQLSRDHSSLSRLRNKAEKDIDLLKVSNEISDRLVALLRA